MSVYDLEAQQQQADSVETYKFTATDPDGTFNIHRYTSHNDSVTIDGEKFLAVPIQRSSFTNELNDADTKCTIKAPIDTLFMQYVASTPLTPTKIEIKKYYITDTSKNITIFHGLVKSITIQGHNANANCVATIPEIEARVPRVYVQSYCNHSLYSPACGVSKADFKTILNNITIDPDDATIITHATLATKPDNYYTYGFVAFGKEKRHINQHSGNEIRLHYSIRELNTGDAITVYAGCDKNQETCINRFDNLDNFLGMPYVPQGSNPAYFAAGLKKQNYEIVDTL